MVAIYSSVTKSLTEYFIRYDVMKVDYVLYIFNSFNFLLDFLLSELPSSSLLQISVLFLFNRLFLHLSPASSGLLDIGVYFPSPTTF